MTEMIETLGNGGPKRKLKRGPIITLLVILILIAGGYFAYLIINDFSNEKDNNNNVVDNSDNNTDVVEDTSKYKMASNPTKYEKELNNEINDLVEGEEYEDKALVNLIAKNFIVEFYTLSNVENRTPGGLQYVPVELQDRFKEFASDIYDYYPYYEDRAKMEVDMIEITNTKSISYDYKDDLGEIDSKNDLNGYEVTLNWTYKNNDSYTTKVKIVMWNEEYGVVSVQN